MSAETKQNFSWEQFALISTSSINQTDEKNLASSSNVVAVLGAQWGDEGKGKLVDCFAASADICAKFNGGANAGHTLVINNTKFAMHLLPCGVLRPNTVNIIGNGLVIHLKTLLEEIESLEAHVPNIRERILISSRAHLLFDFYQKIDRKEEDRKQGSDSQLGTTKRGIGPCYSAKSARRGIRAGELLNWEAFEVKYRKLAEESCKRFGIQQEFEEELSRHRDYAMIFNSMIIDTIPYINQSLQQQKKLLIEGANACMLDIDFGTYPYVTSSSTTAGGISTGLGIPPRFLQTIIGVFKAYLTRVGHGPFPTELHDKIAEHLLTVGCEYGTTTGRKRRCGWLDIPMMLYANLLNGFTALNLTKLDVLSGLDELRICTSYSYRDGRSTPILSYPDTLEQFEQLQPNYISLPGWQQSIAHCTKFKDLPIEAQAYVRKIEELLKLPIYWIGVGPGRQDVIYVEDH